MNQELNLLPFNLEEALKNPERVVYRNGEKPLEWHYFKYAQWQIVSITPQKEIQVNYVNGANHCYDEFDEYLGTKSSYDILLKPIAEQKITNVGKQTAVQWLINHWAKLQKDGEKMTWQQIIHITKLALETEREQIIEAAADHCYPTAQMALNDAERYYEQHYTQTFKP